MMLVEELVRFAHGLDGGHHHAVATTAAEAWSLEDPLFVRSSASHVFVATRRSGRGRLVLRLRPDHGAHGQVLERASRAAASWHARGAPVAAAVESVDGNAVERISGYVVMAMEVIEGETLDEEGVPEQAKAWGTALARLHESAPGVAGLPHTTDLLARDTSDGALADRSHELLALLGALPRTPDVHGVLHGDPESDNVVAGRDGLCFVDPDEAREGWFASDIAFALRDWGPPGGGPDADEDVVRQFLAGYRSGRSLSQDELSWLPLFATVSAVEDLHRFAPHLAAVPDAGWPSWATDLDARVRARAASLRESVLGCP